ncbi:MAG: response regulator [Bdellovibrionales bacterium]|nr:response regulator [Bdellovibrionales bacterium]
MSPKEITILIVDDDEELLSSIATSFRLFQFNVVEKRSGYEAIEFLKENENKVSLIISDIRMPNGGGMDVLEYVRSQNNKNPKVLFISGYSDFTVAQMYNRGVDGFFSKPFRVSAIKDAITKTLLNLNERWSQAPVGHLTMMINKTVESIEPKKENLQFKMGRGGFFTVLTRQIPEVDDLVSFEIKIKDNKPIANLRGQGRVRWVRSEEVDGMTPGAGIEIEYIEDSCRKIFIDWLIRQDFVAYIPE